MHQRSLQVITTNTIVVPPTHSAHFIVILFACVCVGGQLCDSLSLDLCTPCPTTLMLVDNYVNYFPNTIVVPTHSAHFIVILFACVCV